MLYVLLAFVVLLLVFSSTQNKKRRRQAESLRESLQPGVRVVMTSGIYGIVTEIEDDTIVIEISEGVDVRFKKAAVMAVVPHLDEADDETVNGDAIDDEALHAELESLADESAGEKGKTSLSKTSSTDVDDASAQASSSQAYIAEPLDELAKRGRKGRRRGHESGPGAVPSS